MGHRIRQGDRRLPDPARDRMLDGPGRPRRQPGRPGRGEEVRRALARGPARGGPARPAGQRLQRPDQGTGAMTSTREYAGITEIVYAPETGNRDLAKDVCARLN